MKKVWLILLIGLIAGIACSNENKLIHNPESAKKNLLGYWVYDMKINDQTVIPIVHYFSADGNYTVANFLGTTIQKNIWKIEKNKLVIQNKSNEKDSFELHIEKMDEKSMVVSNSRDQERQLWKKGSPTQ